jgi:ActR/RegA family two-component response regulator
MYIKLSAKKKSDVNDLNLWIIENNLSQLRSVFNENGIKTLNDINENMPKLKTIISDTLWGQLTTAVNNTKAGIMIIRYIIGI